MMSNRNVETRNKQVQTALHCFPHILSGEKLATVSCDRACQTAATTSPSTDNLNFYGLLEFVPYQAIVEDSIKELDLPRRALLQWKLPSAHESYASQTHLAELSRILEREESEHGPQRGVLKKLTSDGSGTLVSFNRTPPHHSIMQKPFVEQGVQTVLTVVPHVLDTDEVANVYTELSIQTSITCLPNASISNIVPQLKANLSHARGYSDRTSLKTSHSEFIAEGSLLETESLVQSHETDFLNLPDLENDTSDKLADDSGVTEMQLEESEEILSQTTANAKEHPAVTVTVSATHVKTTRGCQCGSQLINAIASKMRVQASTLKLTPKVFPPNVKFEERMMEVLNTTVAVLQTEMAKLMETYAEDANSPCAPCDPVPQPNTIEKLVEDIPTHDIKNDPRSCNCGYNEKLQNDGNKMLATINENDNVPNSSQKIITEMNTTRQVVDPNTMKRSLLQENVVEETIRTITVNYKHERVLQEKIIRQTTYKGDSDSGKSKPQSCLCEANVTKDALAPLTDDITEASDAGIPLMDEDTINELTDNTNEIVLDEATDTIAPLTDNITEASDADIPPIEEDTVIDSADNTIGITSDEAEDVIAPLTDNITEASDEGIPTMEEDKINESADNTTDIISDEAGGSADDTSKLMAVTTFAENPFDNEAVADNASPPGATSTTTESIQKSQTGLLGDHQGNKRLSFIPCECHPTDAGAAPPSWNSQASEETMWEINEQKAADDFKERKRLSFSNDMPTSSQPSKANEPEVVAPTSDNTIKFEFLLNKSIKDVESVSAESAIVIRATISNPSMDKKPKDSVQTGCSLPDLREQVIRLSVIYKSGATEPEIRTEELLTPGSPVKIIPIKSNVYSNKSTNTQNIPPYTWVCNSPVFGQRPSLLESPFQIYNTVKRDNASSNVCCCFDKPVQRSAQLSYVSFNILPNESEEVDFSMSCPSRIPKATGCVPSCNPSVRVHSRIPPPLPPPPSGVQLGKNSTCVSCSPSQQPPPHFTPTSLPPARTATQLNNEALEIVVAVTVGDNIKESSEKPLSFTYEEEVSYDEPYMQLLTEDETSTAVQTDLALGNKLESESLSSVTRGDDTDDGCSSKTAKLLKMPWGKISLPPPGSYSIKPIKKQEPAIQPCDLKTCKAEATEVTEAAQATEGETQKGEIKGGELEGNESEGGEAEGGEEKVGETEEGEAEGGTPAEDGEGGDEAMNGGEEKERPPPAEPAEPEPNEFKPKQKLLFEDTVYKHNEPYMEGLYKVFPNSDDEDGNCGSRTEMPWKDIILPINCKIRKMKKSKKCLCRSYSKSLSGMFIPSNMPPRTLEEDDDDILELHIGLTEPPSGIISLGPIPSQTVSICSTISNIQQKPRRTQKDCALLIDLNKDSNYSIFFKAGRQSSKQAGVALHPADSQPFEVSTCRGSEGNLSSFLVSIKPSIDCPDELKTITFPKGKETGGLNFGTIATNPKSATAEPSSCAKGNIPIMAEKSSRNTGSGQSIKATISVKRLGEPDKNMALTPGNIMNLKVPDESVSINLKLSNPDSTAKNVTVSPLRNNFQLNSPGPCICKDEAKVQIPGQQQHQQQQGEEEFSPAVCGCTDNIKLDTFKQDPVMAALEAYEAEMKPLRQALTALQEKIRNLNMPEMKGCMCTTALNRFQPPSRRNSLGFITEQSKTEVGGEAEAATRTSIPVAPHGGSSPYDTSATCRYFQAAAFRRPVVQPLPYGYLPPPILPPYRQSYSPAPPISYPASSGSGYSTSCYCTHGTNDDVRYEAHYASHRDPSSRNRRERDHHASCRSRSSVYPKNDICMQARNYGTYPDYRGRTYRDERMAYDDSFNSRQHGRECSRRKCKVQNVISLHSSGELTDYDSPCTSEDGHYYEESRSTRSHRNGERRRTSKTNHYDVCPPPCKDSFDGYRLRPGQAVRTGPEEFLNSTYVINKRAQRSSTFPKMSSKSRIRIKVPYR